MYASMCCNAIVAQKKPLHSEASRSRFSFSHASREGLSTYNSTHSSTLKKLECVSDVDWPTPPRAALACQPKCGGEGPEQTGFGLIVLQKMYLQ